jgi:hypothetical protein
MANLSGNNVGINYKGILNLGSTINQNMSSGFQAITDGDNNASSLAISDTSIKINNKINIGNDAGDPVIFNENPDFVNVSVNTNTIVVSNGYSTGSYDSGAAPPDNAPSAIFEMASTTQGMLLPRMTRPQREDIKAPADGLVVYDTTRRSICYYNGTDWYELDATVIP